VQNLAGKLEALNPRRVLARGYAILLDDSGHAVRRAEETSAGASLTGVLYGGELGLRVERTAATASPEAASDAAATTGEPA
jgi:exodeoxyribonuclease VII large subunit